MSAKYSAMYCFHQKVHVDGEKSIIGKITGIWFSNDHRPSYEVSWFVNGAIQSNEVEEWRLSDAE